MSWPLRRFALAAQVKLAGPAGAYATQVSGEPSDGAVVPAAPPRLTLTFNEPVSPLVLRLVVPDGTSTVLEGTSERGSSVAVTLPSGIAQWYASPHYRES